MDTKNPRSGQAAEALVSIRADAKSLTENHPAPQPATVHQLRARRLVSAHHVRPALALALAALAFGEAR